MSSQSREFEVNQYITLKLENRKTEIYVDDERFIQCKYLILNIPKDKLEDYEEITSIDEISEKLDNSLEKEEVFFYEISPEEEFWGHCSNLQTWAENNYDTCLIHRNLAFPLLKRLTEVGDPLAKKVFKEEIAKRFGSRYIPIIRMLIYRNYLDYLNLEEIDCLLENNFDIILKSKDFIMLKKLEELFYNWGTNCCCINRFKEALKVYRVAIKFFPNNLELLEELANTLTITKELPEAISIYKKVIRLDKNYSKAYINLAKAYLDLKNYNGELKICELSFSSNPHICDLYFICNYLSKSYYNLGRYKEARKARRKFKKLRKDWKKKEQERILQYCQ